MKRPAGWARSLAILAASLCAVATSFPPPYYLAFEPEDRRLFERDGIILQCRGSCLIAEINANAVDKAADHTHASFVVKNGRSDRVTFSTETAVLLFSGHRIPNSEPVILVLGPGETRSVDTRFDFVFCDHPGLIRRGAAATFVPGEAELPDGRRVDFTIPVLLHPR